MTAESELQNKKQKLEEKIEKTAQEIFSLGEGNVEKENHSAEWKTLRTKLADAVWKYAGLVFGKTKIENCTVEIMNCVTNSLHAFKCDAENKYINYISAALKKEIRRANEKRSVAAECVGILFPDKKLHKMRQILRDAESYGKDIHKAETQNWLAERFGITLEELHSLIQMQEAQTVRSLDAPLANADGSSGGENNFSLLDTISDLRYDTLPEKFELQEKLQTALSKIDNAFDSLQDRTKPYIAALVTRQLLEEFSVVKELTASEIASLLENKKFASSTEVKIAIEKFLQCGEILEQQQVAQKFGKDKTDASRVVKKFLQKLGKKCQLK